MNVANHSASILRHDDNLCADLACFAKLWGVQIPAALIETLAMSGSRSRAFPMSFPKRTWFAISKRNAMAHVLKK